MSANRSLPGCSKPRRDKIGGGGGSLFAVLFCLGFPALLAIVSAVGLGFLLRDAVLNLRVRP